MKKSCFLGIILTVGASTIGGRAATDDSWFRIVDGKPVCTRPDASGLSANYGQVGRDGLVWYASFDGNLKSQEIDPSAPTNPVTIEAVKEGAPECFGYVPGVRGQALLQKEFRDDSIAFNGLDRITTNTGTVAIWMYTKDGSINDAGWNHIFSTGYFQLRVWIAGEICLQGWGPTHQVLSGPAWYASNDLKGWNMYALTWVEDVYRVFMNGILVHEGKGNKVPGLRYLTLIQANTGKSRAFDEAAIYNRPLLADELRRQYLALLRPSNDPNLLIPLIKNTVRVDGRLDEAEWAHAAETTGLVEGSPTGGGGPPSLGSSRLRSEATAGQAGAASTGQLSDPQACVLAQYDQTNLYVVVRSPRLEAGPGRRGRRRPSPEAVDVLVSPLDKEGQPGKVYCFTVNSRGQFTNRLLPNAALPAAAPDPSWSAPWQAAMKDNDGDWVYEAAIPWSSLGITPGPGQTFGFNVVRRWKLPKDGVDEWAWGTRCATSFSSGYANVYYHPVLEAGDSIALGKVTLGGADAPVVRVSKVGDLVNGQLDFQATINNPSAQPLPLQMVLRDSSGQPLEEKTITIGAGQESIFECAQPRRNRNDSALVFEARNAAKQLVHRQEWNFVRNQAFEVSLRRLRSVEKLVVQLNCASLAGVVFTNLHAEITVNDGADKALQTVRSARFQSYDQAVQIGTADLPAGEYKLHIRMATEAGKVVAEEKDMPYSRKPLPEWWNNDIGKELGVPYPWTAMKVTGDNGITCWNRNYQFGNRLLPEQIVNWCGPQNKMLRAPMRLVVKSATGETLDSSTTNADAKWTKQTDLRVEGVRTVSARDFAIQNELWSEYDGLVWCRLTIQPKTNVTLNSMELEIPLTREFTDVVNCNNYGLQNTGKLPKEGFVWNLAPMWLGNGDGGIQWFSETDGWFFLKDPNLIHVDMHPEGATMRIVMIDVPTAFAKPHVMEFGFIATPARPKLYRTWADPLQWGFTGGPGPWYPKGEEFLPAPDYWGGTKSGWRGIVMEPPTHMWLTTLYVTTAQINTKTQDFEDFGDEWLTSDITATGGGALTTHASKSYRDWFVWRHWKSFQSNPHQGLYYDGANPRASANPYAGAGYVRRDGTVALTCPILGARDICKRMYNMIVRYYPFAWIGFHQSGMPNMAYEAFGTRSWDGENLNGRINDKQPTYLGVLDPARFRAEYMGHNFGWPVDFLGQSRIRAEWARAAGFENVVDHLHGLSLLHDVTMGGGDGLICDAQGNRACERTYRAIGRHRLYSSAYRFIPYWRQDIVQLPQPEMYASFYVLEPWKIEKSRDWSFYGSQGDLAIPKKTVMIVYNNSDWSGTMRLKPDWKKLGFDTLDKVQAENAVHSTGFRIDRVKNEKGEEVDQAVFFPRPEETAAIENGELVFPMTRFNYRMIAITQPQ